MTIQIFFHLLPKVQDYDFLFNEFYQIWTTIDFGGVLYLLYSIKWGFVLPLLKILLPGIVPWNSVSGGQGCQMLLPRGGLRIIIQNLLNRPVQKMCYDDGNASLFPEMFLLWYYIVDTFFKEISDNSKYSLSVNLCVCLCVCVSLSTFLILKIRSVCTRSDTTMSTVFMTKIKIQNIQSFLHFNSHNKIPDTVYILFNFHWF